jgi:type II secretory pathway predicted ATPase ExeA
MNESLIRPFTRELDGRGCFAFHGHKEALARLKLVLDYHWLGVLTGEIGSGKSVLIRHLIRSLDSMLYLPITVSMAHLKPRDFYGELLRHVDEDPPFSVVKARRLWEEVIARRVEQGDRTIVVVIDEAHDMTEAMLLELRFVMSHQMDAKSLFPVILAGQPELRKRLRLKKFEAISQRVGMQFHLQAMTKEETMDYIRHHMKTAGLDRPLFSESAMNMVYGTSQGIPRVVNQLCTHALLEAEGKGHEVVEEAHMGRILADVEKQRGATG